MFDYHDTQTYTINIAAAGNADIVAAIPGVRWAILCMVLSASAGAVVTIDSDVTEIASLRISSAFVVGDGSSIVMQALASNQKLNIAVTGGDLDGFVQVVTLRA